MQVRRQPAWAATHAACRSRRPARRAGGKKRPGCCRRTEWESVPLAAPPERLIAAAPASTGYKFGDAELPSPPVTRTLADFRSGAAAANDTAALLAMMAWANAQPASAGWIVLGLPEGRLTLEGARLFISRSQTVLRGAGAGATTLYLPSSLTDIQGGLA